MVVVLEDTSTGDRKPLAVGWNWTFFFFSSFLGIPLFRKGLTAWGALIVILWSLDLALPLIMPATAQVVTLSLVSGTVIAVLSVFLAYKGNGLIARKYLVATILPNRTVPRHVTPSRNGVCRSSRH